MIKQPTILAGNKAIKKRLNLWLLWQWISL